MIKKDYYRIKVLMEAAAIDEHLSFIESLLKRYDCDYKRKCEIEDSIEKIRHRKTDDNIYLAVIGEYSTGKSTLINALLKDNILPVDVLPATTEVPAIIQYNILPDIKALYKDGTSKSFQSDGAYLAENILEDVNIFKKGRKKAFTEIAGMLSSKEGISKHLKKVEIYYPYDILKKGIVIIDTQGFDSNGAWDRHHEEASKEVMRDICDTAIIAIPADEPVSLKLVKFMKNDLSDFVHRYLFIVTKIDIVSSIEEREGLVEFIGKRLRSELGIGSIEIFSAAPVAVTDKLGNTEDSEYMSIDDREKYIRQFDEMESDIINILNSQRELLKTEHLLRLMLGIFDEIEGDLREFDVDAGENVKPEKLRMMVIEDLEQIRQRSRQLSLISGKVNLIR